MTVNSQKSAYIIRVVHMYHFVAVHERFINQVQEFVEREVLFLNGKTGRARSATDGVFSCELHFIDYLHFLGYYTIYTAPG